MTLEDLVQEANDLMHKMHLPWSFFEEEHQILTSELLRETGEYGSILCEYHDIISDFIDDEKGRDVVATMNLLPNLIAEIERLRGYEIAARDLSADLTKVAGARDEQAARIEELESSLDEAEALTKKNAELMNGYLGRIAELEDALRHAYGG